MKFREFIAKKSWRSAINPCNQPYKQMFKSYLYLVPALLCLLPGCQLQPSKSDTSEPIKKSGLISDNTNAIAGVPPQVVDRKPLMPLHLAGVLDKTGSTEPNKIPNYTEEQLKTIAKALQERGGEFRLLALCSDSDKVLVHLKIPVPATAPAAVVPLPEETTINSIEYAKLQDEREAKVVEYNKQKAAFDRAIQVQHKANEVEIAIFLKAAKSVLSAPPTCKSTDIVGGINRVDLFLNERQPAGAMPVRKVAFFVTDGIHNTTAATKPLEMKSQPEIVVVSPGAGAGMLEQLQPTKFDSIDAAIDDILSR
jgi:hypothetical protein